MTKKFAQIGDEFSYGNITYGRALIHSSKFEISTGFVPRGDQAAAIEKLVHGLEDGEKHQVLLGVTGSGKTFTMAKVIEALQRPTLGPRSQQDAGSSAVPGIQILFSRTTQSNTLSPTTITTSPKPTSRRRTLISKRTP